MSTQIRLRHPRLREAIRADAEITARHRGERHRFRSRLDLAAQVVRLMWVSDAFCAQVLYRLKARLQAIGVPVVPRLAHRLAITVGQVSIGDPVLVHPGVYILHGQVVIDGITEIRSGCVVGPFVTIGLRAGELRGPVVEPDVAIGTGAKVLGPIHVGAGARIGANAVVVADVPAGATAIGAPAQPAASKGAKRN